GFPLHSLAAHTAIRTVLSGRSKPNKYMTAKLWLIGSSQTFVMARVEMKRSFSTRVGDPLQQTIERDYYTWRNWQQSFAALQNLHSNQSSKAPHVWLHCVAFGVIVFLIGSPTGFTNSICRLCFQWCWEHARQLKTFLFAWHCLLSCKAYWQTW